MKKAPKKLELLNALGEIQTLKNMLGDLLPAQAMSTVQLSNMETLMENNRYSPITLNRVMLAYLYSEHGLIQTAIEVPIIDALRGGLTITSPELDADDIQEFKIAQEEAGDMATLQEAMVWEDLFGGAALIINMDVNPARPWDIKASKPNKLEFYAADRWELNAGIRGGFGDDPKEATYDFYGTKIHRTRLLELPGKKPPAFLRPQFQGWGYSKIEKMVRELNAFMKHNNLIFELLDEAKIDVYSIKNFNTSLMTATGTSKIQKRIQLGNQLKNFNNAVILDTLDKYEQKQLSFGGLSDILIQLRIGIASAFRMPLTKLFGMSATGFNAGAEDLENYNATVESEIRQRCRKAVRLVCSLRMLQMWGYVPKFDFEFKPLRVMTEKEDEEVKTSRQTRLVQLYDKALLTSEELGQAASSYGLLPIETKMQQGMLEDHPTPADSLAQGPVDTPSKAYAEDKKELKEEKPDDKKELENIANAINRSHV